MTSSTLPCDSFFKKKNGSFLVILILVLCTFGAGLTFWNYTQHVFSTSQADVVSSSNMVEAFFAKSAINKIQPHHHARVTIDKQIFDAEVVSVTNTGQKTTVLLRLINKESPLLKNEMPKSCGVTIDTTIPPYSNF